MAHMRAGRRAGTRQHERAWQYTLVHDGKWAVAGVAHDGWHGSVLDSTRQLRTTSISGDSGDRIALPINEHQAGSTASMGRRRRGSCGDRQLWVAALPYSAIEARYAADAPGWESQHLRSQRSPPNALCPEAPYKDC